MTGEHSCFALGRHFDGPLNEQLLELLGAVFLAKLTSDLESFAQVVDDQHMASKKSTKKQSAELSVAAFATRAAFSRWLASHHAKSPGIWVLLAKKHSGRKSITYAEAVEVALSFGWIDGQGKGKDDVSWLQKFTPRRPKSIWSKLNRDRALALIASGQMRPAGMAEVERAKRDGRWQAAYDSPKRSKVPEDLQKALAGNARARAFFAEIDARNRYAILFRVQTAKKPATRARRIAEFVALLARGETLYR